MTTKSLPILYSCLRSLDQFYVVSYYMNLVKNSRTNSSTQTWLIGRVSDSVKYKKVHKEILLFLEYKTKKLWKYILNAIFTNINRKINIKWFQNVWENVNISNLFIKILYAQNRFFSHLNFVCKFSPLLSLVS